MMIKQIVNLVFGALLCGMAGVGWAQQIKNELLVYCGITMVRPITELARSFEQRENVKITIAQGGSEDLFQSAKKSGLGDLYLPGEPSYREKHFSAGLFDEHVIVGYNQLAFMVQKGNPKKVRNEPRELLRKDLLVAIGNAESGSVGQQGKELLDKVGIYPAVVSKAVALVPDSRALTTLMKRGEADLALNWRATAFFADSVPLVDAIDLDPKLATPQALLLIRLKLSKMPALARRFMDYVASSEGQAVFRKHGFLDNKMNGTR
jgi:molybdate transport system substrate-binding protein